MIRQQYDDLFYEGETSELVRFCLNDSVRILTGDHAGEEAWVISIVAPDPEVLFLVELASGRGDVYVTQKGLARIER